MRSSGNDIESLRSMMGCSFPSGYFEVIQVQHVLKHVLDLESFLNEVHRILRPGGLFFTAQPDFTRAAFNQ